MPGSLPYEQILLDQREVMLDQIARGLAGVQGKSLGSEDATNDDEDTAWMARDKRVTAEHLAMLTQATQQELSQQTDETGQPLWTPDEIVTEIKARHTAAQYPYRHLTYTQGIVDPAEQAAKAERVRKRVERKYGMPQVQEMGGWQEVPDDYQPSQAAAPGLADMMSMGQPQPQQQAAPMQGQGGYS